MGNGVEKQTDSFISATLNCQEDQDNLFTKILIVGQKSVGKASLLRQLDYDQKQCTKITKTIQAKIDSKSNMIDHAAKKRRIYKETHRKQGSRENSLNDSKENDSSSAKESFIKMGHSHLTLEDNNISSNNSSSNQNEKYNCNYDINIKSPKQLKQLKQLKQIRRQKEKHKYVTTSSLAEATKIGALDPSQTHHSGNNKILPNNKNNISQFDAKMRLVNVFNDGKITLKSRTREASKKLSKFGQNAKNKTNELAMKINMKNKNSQSKNGNRNENENEDSKEWTWKWNKNIENEKELLRYKGYEKLEYNRPIVGSGANDMLFRVSIWATERLISLTKSPQVFFKRCDVLESHNIIYITNICLLFTFLTNKVENCQSFLALHFLNKSKNESNGLHEISNGTIDIDIDEIDDNSMLLHQCYNKMKQIKENNIEISRRCLTKIELFVEDVIIQCLQQWRKDEIAIKNIQEQTEIEKELKKEKEKRREEENSDYFMFFQDLNILDIMVDSHERHNKGKYKNIFFLKCSFVDKLIILLANYYDSNKIKLEKDFGNSKKMFIVENILKFETVYQMILHYFCISGTVNSSIEDRKRANMKFERRQKVKDRIRECYIAGVWEPLQLTLILQKQGKNQFIKDFYQKIYLNHFYQKAQAELTQQKHTTK